MPRVVPTDVVKFVDRAFPDDSLIFLNDNNVGPLATILDLLERVPEELLALDSASFAALIAAQSQLSSDVGGFRNLTKRDKQINNSYPISRMVAYDNWTPLAVIKRELAKCPDDVPRADLPDLPFIKEAELRNSLRKDLSSAAAALIHDEWKAATVLAGSVGEALLLWALELRVAEISAAVSALDASGAFKTVRKPDPNCLDRWDLAQYTIVAQHLNEIGGETPKAVDLMREFRNLIHPGRAQRTQQSCTRGTAHIAFGALQRVIDDLAQRHP